MPSLAIAVSITHATIRLLKTWLPVVPARSVPTFRSCFMLHASCLTPHVQDPNKQVVRVYSVPASTFESDDDDEDTDDDDDQDQDQDQYDQDKN